MKIFKKILFWIMMLLVLLIAAAGIYIAVVAATAHLDVAKLSSEERSIHIFNADGTELDPFGSGEQATFSELPAHTVNAFVSVEDKRFFDHRGVDYKRIAGAAWHNLKRRSFSEGGSTITQQLIKNTHLSRDKTLSRKIREIKLAYDLERRYSKNQILEMYLNKIYFGNGLYGIKNAAKFYFDKEVSALSVSESAWLAGIVKAPSYYSAQSHAEKSLERKNLVLKVMRNNNALSESGYDAALACELRFAENGQGYKIAAEYINQAVIEAARVMNCDEAEILQNRLSLYTYCSGSLQEGLRDIVLKNKRADCDMIAVVLDNATRGVCAGYCSAPQEIGMIRRQPGSVIKPVLPYAAALEYNKIAPATKILDEPCSFGGYEPKNYKNVYSGYISVRRALEKSSNIVAVKALEYTTIEKAKSFAEGLGLPFDASDNHLAVALGGLTYGFTPLELANAYASFADNGLYSEVKYISAIKDENGVLLYRDFGHQRAAMREDTAFLMTEMLESVTKNGTAKKLSSLPYQIAAKTGTVGSASGNSDAWAIGYTSEHTVAVWCGKAAGGLMSGDILGGTVPCETLKNIFEHLYSNVYPADFSVPPSVTKIAIDKQDYESDNIIRLASLYTPPEYVLTDYFSLNNLPQESSTRFTEPTVKNASLSLGATGMPVIKFDLEKYLTYKVYRKNILGYETMIRQISGQSGTLEIYDREVPIAGIYEYSICAEFTDSAGNVIAGTPHILGKVMASGGAPPLPNGLFDRLFH